MSDEHNGEKTEIIKGEIHIRENDMLKSLGIVIGGVFVGAVAMEIVHKKCPDALDKLYSKSHEIASGAKEAFKKGYENAMRPREAAQSSS